MKPCWDNLNKYDFYLTKNGNLRSRTYSMTYYMKICKTCGEEYIGKKHSTICDNSCKRLTEEVKRRIGKKNKGRKHTESSKQKLREKANKQWNNPENIKKHSEISKKIWKENREKIVALRKHIYDDKWKEKVSNGLKSYYKEGGKTWNDGLTKEQDERVALIGQKNKENLTGRTKDEYEYLKRNSERMKELWKMKNSNMRYMTDGSFTEEEVNKWKEKISNTISKKILNGEINSKNNFKTGYYVNEWDITWYDSGLELEAMNFFDNNNIEWTKKHKIRVQYYDINGKKRYYIPDFKIKVGRVKNIIIEMKGYPDENLENKRDAITKQYRHYYICYSIDDVKEVIDEILKSEESK